MTPDEHAGHREIAACVYELVAALERLCEDAGTGVVVSPYPSDSRIVVETVRDGDEVVAVELLRRLIAEHDLTGSAS